MKKWLKPWSLLLATFLCITLVLTTIYFYENRINREKHSPHYESRNLPISYIILHTTEEKKLQNTFKILLNPDLERSYHYVIAKNGQIYQLVDDNKVAWHAGPSAWDTKKNLNKESIGIALAHFSEDPNDPYFPEEQIYALMKLLKKLSVTYSIEKQNIIGHADIAPDRKEDPNTTFPWEILGHNGFGCWVQPSPLMFVANPKSPKNLLYEIGYRRGTFQEQLIAFQRHFLPHLVSGISDLTTHQRLIEIAEEMVALRGNSP